MVSESEGCGDRGVGWFQRVYHGLRREFGDCAVHEAKAFGAFVEKSRETARRVEFSGCEEGVQGENTAGNPRGQRSSPIDLEKNHRGVAEGVESGEGLE